MDYSFLLYAVFIGMFCPKFGIFASLIFLIAYVAYLLVKAIQGYINRTVRKNVQEMKPGIIAEMKLQRQFEKSQKSQDETEKSENTGKVENQLESSPEPEVSSVQTEEKIDNLEDGVVIIQVESVIA